MRSVCAALKCRADFAGGHWCDALDGCRGWHAAFGYGDPVRAGAVCSVLAIALPGSIASAVVSGARRKKSLLVVIVE